ncbi:hypothetical protein [Streptomyces sp. NPDC059378]|uniref:hypothetical protein n=1 Tax=Streptomyces sp. NPDC059378 TaxID=3346815 RepID=UPI00368849EE
MQASRRVLTTRPGALPAVGGRRSGLRNLAERATELGGTLELAKPQEAGTTLVLRVPAQTR